MGQVGRCRSLMRRRDRAVERGPHNTAQLHQDRPGLIPCGRTMQRRALLLVALCVAELLSIGVRAADRERLTLLSTQLRPITEAQKMRNVILKDFPHNVDYVTGLMQQVQARLQREQTERKGVIDVVGALHGELEALLALDAFTPLDDFVAKAAGRGIPERFMALGRLGTNHQLYMPWMQSSYVMVANKAALPFLPAEANINALSYEDLAAWASTIQKNTDKRLLGFPAGPQGLMHRFFQGYLLPSYTGGVVVPFRSAAAEEMWVRFTSLWQSVDPRSTSYDFMQQPLLAGDVWIAFDHISRVLEALRRRPDDFIAFPAPGGPKGRGYMPVIVGLAVVKGNSDGAAATGLIDYLLQPRTQVATAGSVGFFPVVRSPLPRDIDAGVRLAGAALETMQSAPDALPALQPTGLGQRSGEFDRVFMDTFQSIVLRGQTPRTVLDREAATLQSLIAETGARCWHPDPSSTGPCQVK
jgi:multiple sugar transport system substrate-binding protein